MLPAESEKGGAGYVCARPIKTRDEPFLDWVLAYPEDDRNGGRCCLCRSGRLESTHRREHGHGAANEFRCERRQSIELTLRPAKFDRHVPALDVAGLGTARRKAATTRAENHLLIWNS